MTLTINFYDTLNERLKDIEYAQKYLNVALENYNEDENLQAFLRAVRYVAKAQGGLSKLSRKTQLNRSNLSNQLSEGGKPSIQTAFAIIHGLGFRLKLHRLDQGQSSSPQKPQ